MTFDSSELTVEKKRNLPDDEFTRERLESALFDLSRKLMVVDVVVRRTLARSEGNVTDGQAMRFIVSLLSGSVEEILAISRLPSSPLGEITAADLGECDSPALHRFLSSDGEAAIAPTADPLSMREREVVKCLAEGKSNKEIAGELGLSVNTVQTYRARIMMKLNAHSLSDLFRFAVRSRLIEIPPF